MDSLPISESMGGGAGLGEGERRRRCRWGEERIGATSESDAESKSPVLSWSDRGGCEYRCGGGEVYEDERLRVYLCGLSSTSESSRSCTLRVRRA
jgi:hypothetical protein